MREAAYPYASGDLIGQPQRYRYTPFGGKPFLLAWMADRGRALAGLPDPAQPAVAETPVLPNGGIVQTQELLDWLHARIDASSDQGLTAETARWLNAMIKKFEVTKRVHEAYGPDFRAQDRSACRDLSLYVRFAEVVEVGYARSGALSCLNALLKCLDTLCAQRDAMDPSLAARLATLIGRERDHVTRLAEAVEVRL